MKIKKEFAYKLCKLEAYDKFVDNIKDVKVFEKETKGIDDWFYFVIASFDWISSNEGADYWAEIAMA